ncbi:hypothetical protein BP5796_10741 [Coleophoma crateriformis]|uniref:Cupin type-2 domain-containing protein n=1 Tax=Coleophoma crateriformis TaxID=565419 RepID=A0A3D8QR03_9HELO|nr:hypothetical protein BP5796_10741 [Coleophoma crateriformis]
MLSFLVATVPRRKTVLENPIVFEGGRSQLYLYPKDSDSKYVMRCTTPPQPSAAEIKAGASVDNSIINPPHHFHVYQEEYFEVVRGTMQVKLDGAHKIVQQGETVTIMPGIYHWFSNASESEELVVDIGLNLNSKSRDERFFRNLYSYLEDCNRAGGGEEAVKKGGTAAGGPKTAPNPFQMMLFLHSADVALALPGLPKFVGMPLGRALVWVGAMVGKWVCGFSISYPEYYAG